MSTTDLDQRAFKNFMFFIEKYKVLSFNQIIIRELCNIVRKRNLEDIEKYVEENKIEFSKKHPDVIKELKKINIFI